MSDEKITHDIICTVCRKATTVSGPVQPGQNSGHYICGGCQDGINKTEIKKALEAQAPTVKVDGRAAQTATLSATK